MLTPIEVERKSFKSGFGYEKKDVDAFLSDLAKDYDELYKKSVEADDKIATLNDALSHYKSIEKTLQKALILAQRTADEAHDDAVRKGDAIEREAHAKAEEVLSRARGELEGIRSQALDLLRVYDSYKAQVRALTESTIATLDGEGFRAGLADLEEYLGLDGRLREKQASEREAVMDKEKHNEKLGEKHYEKEREGSGVDLEEAYEEYAEEEANDDDVKVVRKDEFVDEYDGDGDDWGGY